MWRTLYAVACAAALFLMCVGSASAYTDDKLIDNVIFDRVDSLTATQIQQWLEAEYPHGCLTSYAAPEPVSWYNYGTLVPASAVIAKAAAMWQLNPKVILATLQKEQSLVTGGAGCTELAYKTAMGYDCPGPYYEATQSCVAHASNLGFSAQVSHGAWQLAFGRWRSEGDGNLSYDGDGAITYLGFMTAGCRSRVLNGAIDCYDGRITLNDGTALTVQNGATASLYSYTPFRQQFSRIFEQFFGAGSTTAPTEPTPVPDPPTPTPPVTQSPQEPPSGEAPSSVPAPSVPQAAPGSANRPPAAISKRPTAKKPPKKSKRCKKSLGAKRYKKCKQKQSARKPSKR